MGVIVRDQIHSIDADAVVVIKDAEFRGVMNVKFAVDVFQPKHRVQIGGESEDLAVGINAENTIGGRIRRGAHVVGVLAKKHAAIRRTANHRWISDSRGLGHQLHLPARGGLQELWLRSQR